jgi:zinc protease
MHRCILTALVMVSGMAAAATSAPAAEKVLPYTVHHRTLPNGFDVIVIETPEFKNVVSYNTLVLAGARNETEPGKSGLAHLFEHILFRHRFAGQEAGYEKRMEELGTHNNAWTWFDVTYYHPLTFSRNLSGHDGLPGLVELEASRFSQLAITEQIFKTESGAVLGEYRRGASDPTQKMSEKLLELMFPHHPYGHTTIGYLADVIDMPNEYQAAKSFYDTYYRPNNCILVVAGDVHASEVFDLVEKYYGGWKSHPVPEVHAMGAVPKAEQRGHVAWDADVPPLVWVAYRLPAFRPGTVDGSVMLLLEELLVSPAAPLYKHLRYEKQTASELSLEEGSRGFESFDERDLVVSARLYKEPFAKRGAAYFREVEQDVIAGLDQLKQFSHQPHAAELLGVVKSKLRYDFMASLASPESIAASFAWLYRFDRDPDVLDKLVAGVDALTPQDIDAFARQYFVPERRAIVTMAYGPAAGEQTGAQK